MIPVESWVGNLLNRVIPHGLIVNVGIARAEIKELIARGIGTCTEGNAKEAGHAAGGRRGDLRGDVGFDCAVLD